MKPPPPFFIGWAPDVPAPLASFLRRLVPAILTLAVLLAVLVAASQRTIGPGRFEFGKHRTFEGLFLADPVPLLLTEDPVEGETVFYLVAPLKHGFPPTLARELHLERVRLQGSLIQDGTDAMIEVVPGSTQPMPGNAPSSPGPQGARPVTLLGEIVDSKCHLGVMNPGRFKPHRACAILCIRGGIPPILVSHDAKGTRSHHLLVGPDGEPLNDVIADLAAEPVRVTGFVRTLAGLDILYADPREIRRLR